MNNNFLKLHILLLIHCLKIEKLKQKLRNTNFTIFSYNNYITLIFFCIVEKYYIDTTQ